jgi:hypothetical protein
MATRQGRRLVAAVTALTGAVSLIMLVIGLVPVSANAATAGNPTRTSVVQHATFAAPAVSPKCQEVGPNNVVASYVDHELLAVDATYSFVVTCPKGVARIMGDQAYEYFSSSPWTRAGETGSPFLPAWVACLPRLSRRCRIRSERT